MQSTFNRRNFVFSLAALGVWDTAQSFRPAGEVDANELFIDAPGRPLSPWAPGQLDIHHLSTGRGNATFIALPDGTSLVIDVGASNSGLETSFEPRPNASLRPGQWVARYVQRRLAEMGRTGLDYLIVSHFHPDHFGDLSDANPLSKSGQFRLTGVTDLTEIVPVRMIIDRSFPQYDYPNAWNTLWAKNYFAFIKERVQSGLSVQKIVVGRNDQIKPIGSYKEFNNYSFRNLVANGSIWTGVDAGVTNLFPPLDTLRTEDYPNENHCSIALKLSYGKFSYYTGGDLTSYTMDGALPWQDVLGAVAKIAGPVTVATVDHHGMFDSLSAQVVRDLRPQAWVIPTWHISHPDMLQLERLLSQRLYPGERDIFATSVMRENALANQRLMLRLQSIDGHVITRVAKGGGTFTSVVTANETESDTVKLVRGPNSVL